MVQHGTKTICFPKIAIRNQTPGVYVCIRLLYLNNEEYTHETGTDRSQDASIFVCLLDVTAFNLSTMKTQTLHRAAHEA